MIASSAWSKESVESAVNNILSNKKYATQVYQRSGEGSQAFKIVLESKTFNSATNVVKTLRRKLDVDATARRSGAGYCVEAYLKTPINPYFRSGLPWSAEETAHLLTLFVLLTPLPTMSWYFSRTEHAIGYRISQFFNVPFLIPSEYDEADRLFKDITIGDGTVNFDPSLIQPGVTSWSETKYGNYRQLDDILESFDEHHAVEILVEENRDLFESDQNGYDSSDPGRNYFIDGFLSPLKNLGCKDTHEVFSIINGICKERGSDIEAYSLNLQNRSLFDLDYCVEDVFSDVSPGFKAASDSLIAAIDRHVIRLCIEIVRYIRSGHLAPSYSFRFDRGVLGRREEWDYVVAVRYAAESNIDALMGRAKNGCQWSAHLGAWLSKPQVTRGQNPDERYYMFKSLQSDMYSLNCLEIYFTEMLQKSEFPSVELLEKNLSASGLPNILG